MAILFSVALAEWDRFPLAGGDGLKKKEFVFANRSDTLAIRVPL